MAHDPERNASAYLDGALRSRARARFEEHLMGCESCWLEVDRARMGRGLAEATRELAPQDLRERVRASVAAEAANVFPRRRLATALAVAILVAIASVAGVLIVREEQPAVIAAAVQEFRSESQAPVSTPPSDPAPDLTSAGLTLDAQNAGRLDEMKVDVFHYRDSTGHRLTVYVAESPFPVAAGARRSGEDGPWRASAGGLELLCSQVPHSLLAVSSDALVLEKAAEAMGIGKVPA